MLHIVGPGGLLTRQERGCERQGGMCVCVDATQAHTAELKLLNQGHSTLFPAQSLVGGW